MDGITKQTYGLRQRRAMLRGGSSVQAMMVHGACLRKPGPINPLPPEIAAKYHAYVNGEKVTYGITARP